MPSPDRGSGERARRALPAILGVVVSVGLLVWALRGVSLQEVWRQIRGAHPLPLAVAVILATLTFPVRLVRWRFLLPQPGGEPYPAGPLWHAVALGFMANNILPLRAGELIRSYTASRLLRIRFSTVLSSVAVERIFDGLTVVALLSGALLFSDLPPGVAVGGTSVASLARIGGLAGCLALLVSLLVLVAPAQAEALVRRVVRHPKLAEKLVSIIEGIREGLRVLRSPARLGLVVVWSLILWTLNALAFFIAFGAFDISVSYWGALLLQGLLVLGVSVPSTPGFFGVFEAVVVAVLAVYGISRDLAFSYAISYHITSFVPITLLGLWSLVRTPGGLSRIESTRT